MNGGPLKPDPVGKTVARGHLKDLEATIAARREGRGIVFIGREHVIRALNVAPAWRKEGRISSTSDNATQRCCVAADISPCRIIAPLHELLEIVQVVVHDFLSSYCSLM